VSGANVKRPIVIRVRQNRVAPESNHRDRMVFHGRGRDGGKRKGICWGTSQGGHLADQQIKLRRRAIAQGKVRCGIGEDIIEKSGQDGTKSKNTICHADGLGKTATRRRQKENREGEKTGRNKLYSPTANRGPLKWGNPLTGGKKKNQSQ